MNTDARNGAQLPHRGYWLRRRQLAHQVAAALEHIAADLEEGVGLLPAVQEMVRRSRGPLRQALAQLPQAVRGGPGLEKALLEARARLESFEFTVLVHAVILAARFPVPPPALFRRMARRLRARELAQRRVNALLARARRLAAVAALLLLVAMAGPLALDPAAIRALASGPAGWLLAATLTLIVGRGLLLLGRAACDGAES